MIYSPQALARWRVHGHRHYIGGDSDSTTTSTNQTTYNDNRSVVNNDLRNYAVTDASHDSHNITDASSRTSIGSGNTTITNTGTDAALIVQQHAQLMSHMADEQLGSIKALAALGADVGRNASDLASQSASNALRVSESMLDKTGDIINKLASASASGAAMSATLATAGASTAQTAAKDQQMRMLMLGALVLIGLVALRAKG